jgi:hypothetical protein
MHREHCSPRIHLQAAGSPTRYAPLTVDSDRKRFTPLRCHHQPIEVVVRRRPVI